LIEALRKTVPLRILREGGRRFEALVFDLAFMAGQYSSQANIDTENR
jgi:hypothetical protein